MFTGIVKALGTITAMETRDGDVRLTISSADLPWDDYDVGESIAVNGVCLTAVALHDGGFDTDVSTETLDVTAMRSLGEGFKVNLEPSLSIGDRLGGHLVSGHIDCVGRVVEMHDDARSIRLAIEIPQEFSRYISKKGSVCVDGVSLTINEVSGNRFESNIIPHTADVTIIGNYQMGSEVNIEVDMLARYLERLLGKDDDGLTVEFLREHGYA